MALSTLVAMSAVPADAQSPPSEEALSLIVGIEAHVAPDGFSPEASTQFGAGVIIGVDQNTLIIATAWHVVSGAESLTVEAFSADVQARRKVPGELVGSDQPLDVAILEAQVSAEVAARIRPSLDRLGDHSALDPNDPVYPVGCPDGVCWTFPSPADQVLSPGSLIILFQSTFVKAGNSGGALLDGWGEVVGMVVRNDFPRAEALAMDAVMQVADSLGLVSGAQSRLASRSLPRAGYGTTIGVSAFGIMSPPTITAPGGEPLDGFIDSRLPTGRITLSRRMNSGLGWHVGGLRLAPQNIAVTAGMVGLNYELLSGRFVVKPFVEAGMGRVVSRHDIGGFSVSGQYQPVWGREERDGIGLGGGGTVEITVLQHVILELTAASWTFGLPENAPALPPLYLGGGLRLGL